MEQKNLVRWFEKETLKDQKEIQQHKLNLIKEIKKDGIEGIIRKTNHKKINIWKRMKNFLFSWNNLQK